MHGLHIGATGQMLYLHFTSAMMKAHGVFGGDQPRHREVSRWSTAKLTAGRARQRAGTTRPFWALLLLIRNTACGPEPVRETTVTPDLMVAAGPRLAGASSSTRTTPTPGSHVDSAAARGDGARSQEG